MGGGCHTGCPSSIAIEPPGTSPKDMRLPPQKGQASFSLEVPLDRPPLTLCHCPKPKTSGVPFNIDQSANISEVERQLVCSLQEAVNQPRANLSLSRYDRLISAP